jgi:hypothetical protein
MKFKEYVASLVKYLEEHPETAEFDTIYAADDEGNAFQVVGEGDPTVGNYDGEYRGEFMSHPADLAEYEVEVNAVCIN